MKVRKGVIIILSFISLNACKNTNLRQTKSNEKLLEDEEFIRVAIEEVNQLLSNEKDDLSAKEIMNFYYPKKNSSEEGNEKIEIYEKLAENGNTLVTLIHDNLFDDSVKAEKHIMEIKRTNSKWRVIEIRKNWKCQKNRGHTNWGIALCK